MTTEPRPRRTDGRQPTDLRPVRITPGYLKFPAGSALIECGDTKVICAASIDEKVPPFLAGTGQGWVTGEYSMLPGSTLGRQPREVSQGKIGGRTHEIQRLIGRSLRAVTDMKALGERTVWLDCDVIQADGGTRTAGITGAFVALVLALAKARERGLITGGGAGGSGGGGGLPVRDFVAATSVGIIDGVAMLDLAYSEDSRAGVDMNLVATGAGRLIEVQGTGEHSTFSRQEMEGLMDLALRGIGRLIAIQKDVLGPLAPEVGVAAAGTGGAGGTTPSR